MKGGWLNKDMRMFFKMAVTWSEVKPCLSGSVLNIIDKFGFSSMTPVQVYKMIILLLPYDGHSVMVLTLGFFTQVASTRRSSFANISLVFLVLWCTGVVR